MQYEIKKLKVSNLAFTQQRDMEYRFGGQGTKVALLLYGGHTNVNTHLGEDYFTENGYKILTVTRPGYGNTPLSTGRTPDGFADALSELFGCLHIQQALVVGISAGGRTAMRFAAKYPTLVGKLILQSSISFAPWPNFLTRVGTYVGFNPFSEKYIWKLMRAFLKKNPKVAIKMMFANMTTLDPRKIVKNFTNQQIQELVQLFTQMGSGRGFVNDIKTINNNATDITVPTLIIHSKYDKSVPLTHPRLLAQQIPNSSLFLSEAESHMIWFSPHYAEIKKVMDEFLHG